MRKAAAHFTFSWIVQARAAVRGCGGAPENPECHAARRPGRETSDRPRWPPPYAKVYRNRWRGRTRIQAWEFPVWQDGPWLPAPANNSHSGRKRRPNRGERPHLADRAPGLAPEFPLPRDSRAAPCPLGQSMRPTPDLAAKPPAPVSVRLPLLSTFFA